MKWWLSNTCHWFEMCVTWESLLWAWCQRQLFACPAVQTEVRAATHGMCNSCNTYGLLVCLHTRGNHWIDQPDIIIQQVSKSKHLNCPWVGCMQFCCRLVTSWQQHHIFSWMSVKALREQVCNLAVACILQYVVQSNHCPVTFVLDLVYIALFVLSPACG